MMMMMMMMMMMIVALPVGKLEVVWPSTKVSFTQICEKYRASSLLTTPSVGRGHLQSAFGLFMCCFDVDMVFISWWFWGSSAGLISVTAAWTSRVISDDGFLGKIPQGHVATDSWWKRISLRLCMFFTAEHATIPIWNQISKYGVISFNMFQHEISSPSSFRFCPVPKTRATHCTSEISEMKGPRISKLLFERELYKQDLWYWGRF